MRATRVAFGAALLVALWSGAPLRAEAPKAGAPRAPASARPVPMPPSKYFAFGASQYVAPQEAKTAGLVMTPQGVAPGTKLPVVVFLHGLNERGPLHMWLGSPGRPDLRSVFARAMQERPFVLVAPSQTIHADDPWKLWDALDASALVAAAASALEGALVLDSDQIFVVAHSGGACNLHGGALGAAISAAPARVAGLVVLDACFDVKTAARYLQIPPQVPIWVRYQTDSWDRDIPGFLRAMQGRSGFDAAHAGVRGPGAHDAVLTGQLGVMLRRLPLATAPRTEP